VASVPVLRQRWYFTGPDHPLHPVEDAVRRGCPCQVSSPAVAVPPVPPVLPACDVVMTHQQLCARAAGETDREAVQAQSSMTL
jgi:hypothetical protein